MADHTVRRIEVDRNGRRLDAILAAELPIGRRQARRLIAEGLVRVDGHWGKAGARVPRGCAIEIFAPPTASAAPLPPDVDILACTDAWIAASKPAGMHSVRGRGGDSVAAVLAERVAGCDAASPDPRDSGLVQRLDRDTSGVILAARDGDTWQRLRSAFAQHTVRKSYVAIVEGCVKRPARVEIPLARLRSRVRRARKGEKAYDAITEIEPLESTPYWSMVAATMRTGVTHQIRAHLALCGHPLVGDLKYAGPAAPAGTRVGQLLHAVSLEIEAEGIDVKAPLPKDFEQALAVLRKG